MITCCPAASSRAVPSGLSATRRSPGAVSAAAPTVSALISSAPSDPGGSELEDDPGRHRAGEDFGDRLVDLVEFAVDRHHSGAPGGVQVEHVRQIVAGANDGADDGFAVDD